MQFGVSAFPEQKIGQTLLAAGADDEIDVAKPPLAGDEIGEHLAGEICNSRDPSGRIEDGVARGVIYRDAQMQYVAACRRLFRASDRSRDAVR